MDWDGTLSNSRFWDRWIGSDKYERIQTELFMNARGMLNEWMCGSISYRTVLKYLEDRTGIEYKELEDELRYSAEHMEFIDREVIDLIGKLRNSGIKIVVATDNMDTFNQWTVPALNLNALFDEVLVSDANEVLKAHIHNDGSSLFFGRYLRQNAIDPTETVLIDNSKDAEIVESFGMNFLYVDEEHSLTAHLKNLSK